MYKTIIILLLLLGGLLLLGYQIALLFHLSAALHTHAQMRIKAKVYFGRPRPHTVIKRARGQSRTPSECRQFFETAQVNWWSFACVELVRPHSSAEHTLNAARTRLCARRNGTRKVKKPLGFSSSLEMF